MVLITLAFRWFLFFLLSCAGTVSVILGYHALLLCGWFQTFRHISILLYVGIRTSLGGEISTFFRNVGIQ
jgi:hypothetical protein